MQRQFLGNHSPKISKILPVLRTLSASLLPKSKSKLRPSKQSTFQAMCLKRMTGFLGAAMAGIEISGKAPKIRQIKDTLNLRIHKVVNLWTRKDLVAH